jgi:hypothetical protein
MPPFAGAHEPLSGPSRISVEVTEIALDSALHLLTLSKFLQKVKL